METIVQSVIDRGDLAHLALFLWAGGASILLLMMTREVFRVHASFNAFVRELTRFNERVHGARRTAAATPADERPTQGDDHASQPVERLAAPVRAADADAGPGHEPEPDGLSPLFRSDRAARKAPRRPRT